jgi:hypothetical protein
MLPKGAMVGDQVRVELQLVDEDSQPVGSELFSDKHTLTADDLARGYVELTVNNGTGDAQTWTDGRYKAVARLFDEKGIELEGSNVVDFEIDITPPQVDFELDAITGDDFVAGAEKTSETLTLTGFATGEFNEGDTVTITLKNAEGKEVVYTTTLDDKGRAVFTGVSGNALVTDADKRVACELTTQDEAGNQSTVDGGRAYLVEGDGKPIDPTKPEGEDNPVDPDNPPNEGTWTAIRIDPITGDNIITQLEINEAQPNDDGAKQINITGEVTGKFAAEDVVYLHLNNKVYEYELGSDGSFSVDVLATDLQNDVDSRIDAIVTGTGGDTATANQSYQFVAEPIDPSNPDPAPPEQPDPEHGGTTALFIDPITDDNIINMAESQGNVTVSGRVTGAFDEGDIVTLTLNLNDGAVVKQEVKVNAEGEFEASFNGQDLVNDADTAIKGTVTGTGGTTAHATQNYGVITDLGELKLSVLWAEDGIIDSRELETEGGVVVRVTLPDQVSPGDKLTVNLYRVGTTEPIDTQIYIVKLSDMKAGEPSVVDVLFEPNPANNLITSGSINLKGYFVSNEKFEAQATLEDDYLNTSTSGKDSFGLEGRPIDGFSPSQNGQERIYTGDIDRHIVIGSVNGTFFNGKVVTDIGNDWVYGGDGNDIIIGGSGRNTLTGGAGSDTFKYNLDSLGAIDTITDFTFGTGPEKGVLMLKDLLPDATNTNAADFFELAMEGTTVLLKIHTDGNKNTVADLQISLIDQSNPFGWTLQQMIDDGNIVVE